MSLTVEQLTAKDLSNAVMLGKWVEQIQLKGSFSDRRPDLGKMFRCPGCGRRHHMIGPKCSNARYATTQRAWTPEEGFHQTEVAERVNENFFSKKTIQKITHKKHGQNKQHAAREMYMLMQRDSELVEAAVKEMNSFQPHLKFTTPDAAGLPAFAAKYWLFKQEARDRAARRRARMSRQINRRVQ